MPKKVCDCGCGQIFEKPEKVVRGVLGGKIIVKVNKVLGNSE